jgi:cytochrome b561
MAIRWRDDGFKYGAITRALHWSVAGLLAWQFLSMAVKLIVGRSELTAFMVGSHKPIGTLLMVLIVSRALWGFYNLRQRPSHGGGLLGMAALGGHLLLYGLMLVVPFLALLRQYGSGRPLEVFGLTLMPGGYPEIAWMTAPGDALHGLLAWVLLAAIVGHIGMVLVHRYVWKDNTVGRMMG